MSSQKIKFRDKGIDKKIDLSKIVVSDKWKINDTIYKYFCGYLNNDVHQPLCVILPQMSGYIKYFDNGRKNMSFVTDDKEVYEKYNEIWNVVKRSSNIESNLGRFKSKFPNF